MGRASREKRDRRVQAQIQTALEALSAGKPGQAWHESIFLRVSLTAAFAFINTVVSVMVKDVRFLLWGTSLLLIYPCWVLSEKVGNRNAFIRHVCFIVLIGLLVIGTYKGYAFLKESPIVIAPVKRPLAHSTYPGMNVQGNYDFVVNNRGDDPYYQVWIKLLLNSEVVIPEMLDLDFPTLEERERGGVDVTEMAAGTMCIRGKDNIRRPSFLCVIDTLNPKETFKIRLTATQSFNNASGNDIGEITATVLMAGDKPSMHYKVDIGKKTGTAAEHTYPEQFFPTSMIHFCSQKRNDLSSHMRVTCTKNSRANIKHTK